MKTLMVLDLGTILVFARKAPRAHQAINQMIATVAGLDLLQPLTGARLWRCPGGRRPGIAGMEPAYIPDFE